MLTVADVYRPEPHDFELRPFEDRVIELVRLFHDHPVVRLRITGTIAAGEPIEALPDGETVDVRGPLHAARRHRALLRQYLCPALSQVSGDAFAIARIVTPLLAGLKLSGHAPSNLDLDPWLFAGISLLVARMGVAAFCADDQDEDEGADDEEPVTLPVEAHPPSPSHPRRHRHERHHRRAQDRDQSAWQ